jgi:hypothetical protein
VNIGNLRLDLLLVLQIVSTAVLIFLYALFVSFREHIADRESESKTILLLDFYFQNTESATLLELVEAEDKELPERDYAYHLKFIQTRYDKYRDTGQLPTPDMYHPTPFLDNILLFFAAAPLWSLFTLVFLTMQARAYRVYRIQYTDIRTSYVSKLALSAFGNLVYLLIALELLLPLRNDLVHALSITLVALNLLGLFAAIATIMLLTWWQVSWKSYWQDALLQILATASHRSDHDVFNRALILTREIKLEPDIPIPGTLGAYVVVYSAVQVVLVWISNNVSWL